MKREICDLIVSFDPTTLRREPVRKADVLAYFRAESNRLALRVVDRIPTTEEGVLDPIAVDSLLVRVHCEMQRLSEEMQHGRRVMETLQPILAALREQNVRPPYKIVDIGCGTGYVIRWLSAYANFGPGIELLGVDFNPALIAEAQRLARLEKLSAQFRVANAFALPEGATILISTGVLHHFEAPELPAFFAQHNQPGMHAFVHFDFQRTPVAGPGSWIFHYLRMRERLCLHDGVRSALLAHPASTLLSSARTGAPQFSTAMFGQRLWHLPIPRVFHAILGIRPLLLESFTRQLGSRVIRLGETA